MTPSTKQALAASLKKLLRRKFLDDITVKEIVADCSVMLRFLGKWGIPLDNHCGLFVHFMA